MKQEHPWHPRHSSMPVHLVIPGTTQFPFEVSMRLSWSSQEDDPIPEPSIQSLTLKAIGTTPITGEAMRRVAVKRLMTQGFMLYEQQRRDAV